MRPVTVTILLLIASSWQPSQAQLRDVAAAFGDDALAEIGFEFQEAINFGDVEWAASLFDAESLAMRVADMLTANPAERTSIAIAAAGNSDLIGNIVQQHINLLESSLGYATFLRVHTIDDMRGPLLRYDLGEEGFNYILLIVEDIDGGGPKIVDMYVGANGERLSVSAGAVAQLMIDPSPGLLTRLFGQRAVDSGLLESFQSLASALRGQDYAAAYETIASLPDDIRDHRLLVGFSAQIGGMLDDETYETELARLATLHGDDPRTAFMMIDYHFLREDFGAAMESVEVLEQIFGFDAAIALFKTNIAVELGDAEAALAFAEAGRDAEPFDENSLWALVTAYLAAKRYDDVVAGLVGLETEFGYVFSPDELASLPIYAEFARSPQFAAWSADR